MEMEEALYETFVMDIQQSDSDQSCLPGYPPIIKLEQSLLEVAADPDLLYGLVYILPIKYHQKLFIRYFEAGSYTGFFPTCLELLKHHYQLSSTNIFPWEVFTDSDLEFERKNLKPGRTNTSTKYNRKVGTPKKDKMNNNSILNQVSSLQHILDKTRAVLFIHKARANPDIHTHRYSNVQSFYLHL